MTFKKRKVGFALISVLALVSILMLLLGALMGTNRTTFQLLRVTQSKDRTDRTISSVYAYCRYRLEHDNTWAKGDRTRTPQEEWGHLQLNEMSAPGSDIRTLTGEDRANRTTFTIEICNNLKADGEVAVLKDIRDGNSIDSVPVGFARLNIKVAAGGNLDGAVITMRNPGLIGASLLVNGNLSLDTHSLDLFTKDPIKNQARSLSKTEITGAQDFLKGANATPNVPAFVSNANPVVWSGGASEFRATDSDTFQGREAFKSAHPGFGFKDERFIDESRTLFEIPDVKLEDLVEVKLAAGGDKPVQQIHPGQYRFEQYGSGKGRVRVLTRRTAQADLNDPKGPVEKYWWTYDPDKGTTTRPSDADVASLVGAGSSLGTYHAVDHPTTSLNAAEGGGFQVDLLNRRLVLDEKFNFEVDGDFSVIGSAPKTNQNPKGDDKQRQVNPAVYFGNPEKIFNPEQNFTIGAAVATVTSSPEKGSLKVKNGALHIQGDISGSATLAATGDVSLAPNRFFDNEGNADVNFSVFSEGNVSIVPPPILESYDDRKFEDDGTVTLVEMNGTELDETIGSLNVSENKLKFTGLIFARGTVDIDLQDAVNKPGSRRSLTVEGAIVSRGGSGKNNVGGALSVRNADNLNIIYNPQFVDRLVPSLFHQGQNRLEVTGWRATKPSSL